MTGFNNFILSKVDKLRKGKAILELIPTNKEELVIKVEMMATLWETDCSILEFMMEKERKSGQRLVINFKKFRKRIGRRLWQPKRDEKLKCEILGMPPETILVLCSILTFLSMTYLDKGISDMLIKFSGDKNLGEMINILDDRIQKD